MAITSITVLDAEGSAVDTLIFGGSNTTLTFGLSAYNGVMQLDATSAPATITPSVVTEIDPAWVSSAYNQYVYKYNSGGIPITKLNGVAPAGDGNFFLLGGGCVSLWPTTARRTRPVISGGTITRTEPAQAVYDLCPTCVACDAMYTLVKAAEYYKIYLNALKDVNLYNNSLASTRTTGLIEQRTAASGGTDPGVYACSIKGYSPVDVSDSVSFTHELRGLQLLRQYITTVHMWNYAVTRKGTQTKITPAPEDNGGIVIQTKYALPTCVSGTSTESVPNLRCIVNVSCSFYPKSDDIRVVATKAGASSYTAKRICVRDTNVDSDGNPVSGAGVATRWMMGTYTSTTQATASRSYLYTPPGSSSVSQSIYTSVNDVISSTTPSAQIIYSYNPLSLYIPEASLSFRPVGFDVQANRLAVSSSIEVTGGTIIVGSEHGSSTSDIDRRIVAAFYNNGSTSGLRQAGTYNVSLKLLPFVHTHVYSVDSGGAATLVDFETFNRIWMASSTSAYTPTGGGTGSKTTWYFDIVPVMDIMDGTTGNEPTLSAYNGAKAYPSKSPTADPNNCVRWDIGISWTLASPEIRSGSTPLAGGTTVYTEHYTYETAAAREYIDGLFDLTTLITTYTPPSSDTQ